MSKASIFWRLAVPALLLTAQAVTAHAQYQWRDENGRMVFSDQPPPKSIDPGKVLRSPPARAPAAPAPSANPGNGDAPNAGDPRSKPRDSAARPVAAGPESTADKDLAAKRKAALQAEADKKKREEAEHAAKVARACDDMRTEVRTLETGMRVARVNAQGEREFLSDEERAKRVQTVQRDIKESCR